MPHQIKPRTPAREPTPFPELNTVLGHLVREARATLGDNFLGAYLEGSFAVGDADEFSDCDFLIVTRRDLSAEELAGLQTMHAAIHELPYPKWRNQLEGSYAPAAILRRWSTTPRDPPGEPRSDDWADPGTSGSPALAYPFWYLGHGAKTLVRSEHDNTQVVRWCVREKGVVLAGPDPRALVDPVPPEALRTEVRRTIDHCLALDLQPINLAVWQVFWMGLYCRMLHTLASGQVHSKKAGTSWAIGHLDPVWRGLIERAQALRKGMPQAWAPADPADVEATHAFARYAVAWADRQAKMRAALSSRRSPSPHGPPRGPRGGPGARGQHAPAVIRPGQRGRRG